MDDELWIDDEIDSPNYTQVPNLFMDWALPRMTGPEWKVLSYLARRTWGYHHYDEPVPISVSDIVKGAGVARSTATNILRDLEERGFIAVTRHASDDHGTEKNSYRLRVRKSGTALPPPRKGYTAVRYREPDTRHSQDERRHSDTGARNGAPLARHAPMPNSGTVSSSIENKRGKEKEDPYASGRYGVCPTCGTAPCAPTCPDQRYPDRRA